MPVQFFFLHHNLSLTNRKALKQFIALIFKQEKKQLLLLNHIFCTDEYLLQINKTHLKHNFYTDIITFNLSETPKGIIGEIYISTDRVRDNAALLSTTINEELHRVIFHGALHLCGYRDKAATDIKKMRLAEDRCLKLYFKS